MFYEVVIDAGETANKCTIAPLASRADFRLMRVGQGARLGPLESPVLLHHEGRSLLEIKNSGLSVQSVSCVDCVWRRLDPILRQIQGPLPVLASIPGGFKTAYPRHSEKPTDPEAGLATIEAIFVAQAILGHWDTTLFSKYPQGRAFVEMNLERFLELGVHPAGIMELRPVFVREPKTSKQRKLDRGRAKC